MSVLLECGWLIGPGGPGGVLGGGGPHGRHGGVTDSYVKEYWRRHKSKNLVSVGVFEKLLPPMVMRVWFCSSFCGRTSHTTLV